MASRRCGCASDQCACVVQAGDGVEVSGSGTKTNPYVIDASVPLSSLTVQDENTVVRSGVTTLDFTGSGVSASAGAAGEVVVNVSAGIGGIVPSVQVFTANGTWNKPANLLFVMVEVAGAGGAGGGAQTPGTGQSAAGGAGGGGGYARKVITASALGASVAVTVGSGGASVAGNNAGGDGGPSSFGTFCTGNGGKGGGGGASSTLMVVIGGVGGTGTGGDLNITGGQGDAGRVYNGLPVSTGSGGDSILGHGAGAMGPIGGGAAPGGAYGGGGAGGGTRDGVATGNVPGGNGANGVVVVTSYVKT